MKTHSSRITLQYKRRHNVWRDKKNVIIQKLKMAAITRFLFYQSLTISQNSVVVSYFIIYTITNWQVSLSKICHEWPNNAVTYECAQPMSVLQSCLVTSNLYVSNWKPSYDIDNEMARKIARVKSITITSLWNNKRLLHDIFHIGPGISPRLPYQARQRSWRADMGQGLIPGTIWKISCHNLFITYFTLTFSKHWLFNCKKDLCTDKLRK
jgi:hypothetical protein